MKACILRVEKLKTEGGVSSYAGHNSRQRDTPNADPARTAANSYLVGGGIAMSLQRWRSRMALDPKPRKNAVIALDYMVHASPKSLTPEARDKYLMDAFEWIAKRHGRDNIVQAVIHRDEVTEAHLHVIVVPLIANKKGIQKLNASHWLDGRAKLSAMQTEFAKEVGRVYDLERGVEGSKAKHEKVKRVYGAIEKGMQNDKVPNITFAPEAIERHLKAGRTAFDLVRTGMDALRKQFLEEWGPIVKLQRVLQETKEKRQKREKDADLGL